MIRPLLVTFLSLVSAALTAAESPSNEQAATEWMTAKCQQASQDLLWGFTSPAAPSKVELSSTCTCASETVRGRAWQTQRQLESIAVQAIFACAKPVALMHGRRFVLLKFEPLFESKHWSPRQIEVFANCAAERLWSVSVEYGRSSQQVQPRDLEALVNDCSAMVSGK